VSPSRLYLLIVQTVQGTTPAHQYDPTTVIDSFSTLQLDDAILPESDGPPQYTDHTPRVEASMSAQSGRRGPSLPFSPSQGLPARSPPPQDSVYPNPPYDDSASYHSGHESLPNDDQIGSHATHQYWNDSVAYSSDSYGTTDPPSQYHQPPHPQAYFQRRECLKELVVQPLTYVKPNTAISIPRLPMFLEWDLLQVNCNSEHRPDHTRSLLRPTQPVRTIRHPTHPDVPQSTQFLEIMPRITIAVISNPATLLPSWSPRSTLRWTILRCDRDLKG